MPPVAIGVGPIVRIGAGSLAGGLLDWSDRLREDNTLPGFEYGPPGAVVSVGREEAASDLITVLGTEDASGSTE